MVVVETEGRCIGRTRLAPIKAPNRATLHTWLKANVAEKTRVGTDGFRAYLGLDELFEHQREVIGNKRLATIKFPFVHRVISLFKLNVESSSLFTRSRLDGEIRHTRGLPLLD